MKPVRKSALDVFLEHLDVCDQCREHPFALCRTGYELIRKSSEEDAIAGAHRIFGLEPPR